MSEKIELTSRSQSQDLDSPSPTMVADTEAQQPEQPLQINPDEHAHGSHPLAQLSSTRKTILLMIFAISTFVDVCNVSGVSIAVAQIGNDTGLKVSQLVWIITSYSICFAAFLLFAGRLSDLFPAQIIFVCGFAGLGVFSLVVAWVNHSKFGFLILRGLGGICGALTIPSSYHLLVHMYPAPEEQKGKLAVLSMSGAIGNVLGLLIAGVSMIQSYRVFFWVIASVCLAFSALTVFVLPFTGSSYSHSSDPTPRWKRMDLPGVIIMMGALICFILSLTQGPIDGWGSASFIAPFILSWVLGVGFFFWESKIPAKSAVLPSAVWKVPNVIIASLVILYPFAFWATSQIQLSTYWQEVHNWSPIHVAVAILPQGIASLITGGAAQAFPIVINKPRHTIVIGGLLVIASDILLVYSHGGTGMNFWKYCFPSFVLGSIGALCAFFAASINLVSYCPPEMAGVAGAWVQVCAQLGTGICLAVQAGLQTDLSNWMQSSGRSFWFMVAWVAAGTIAYVVFFKEFRAHHEEHAATRERIKASGKEI